MQTQWRLSPHLVPARSLFIPADTKVAVGAVAPASPEPIRSCSWPTSAGASGEGSVVGIRSEQRLHRCGFSGTPGPLVVGHPCRHLAVLHHTIPALVALVGSRSSNAAPDQRLVRSRAGASSAPLAVTSGAELRRGGRGPDAAHR